jgi:hypothetical protein
MSALSQFTGGFVTCGVLGSCLRGEPSAINPVPQVAGGSQLILERH